MAYYENVIFDEVDITEIIGVYITDVIDDTIPQVILSEMKLARQDGTKLFNKQFGSKEILIEGHIATTSRDEFKRVRSELLSILPKRVKTLQIPNDTMPHEYSCTAENILFSNLGGGYGKFSIKFTTTDPYGYERDLRTVIDATANTEAENTFTLSEAIEGDVATPGLFTITLTDITDGDATIELESQAGESITIAAVFVDGDIVEVDMKAKTVKVNGILTDYTGNFWNFHIAETYFVYRDTFTDRNMTMTSSYKPRVL